MPNVSTYSHRCLVYCLKALVISVLYSGICQAQTPSHKVKVALDWQHAYQFAGFYSAIEQGYFAEYGIEVELVELSNHRGAVEELTSGNMQFAIMGSDLLVDFHRGNDIRLLANYFKRSPLAILTRHEINTLDQLEGKTIMGLPELKRFGSLYQMLDFNQVEIEKIKTIPYQEDYLDKFKRGDIDGMLIWVTDEPFFFNRQNIPYRVYDPNQYGIATQNLNLITTPSFESANPQLTMDFEHALDRGWEYALENPDTIIELILDKYNTQNFSRAALEFEARETAKFLLPELYPMGKVDTHLLKTMSDYLLANDVVPELRDLKLLIADGVMPDSLVTATENFYKSLSPKERKFAAKIDHVRVQNHPDLPPYSFMDGTTPQGMSIDYINLLSWVSGIDFEFVQNKSWAEFLEMLRTGELDLMVNVVQTPEREEIANFTPSTLRTFSSLVVKKDGEFSETTLEQLSLEKGSMGVIKGFFHRNLIKLHYPDITIVEVRDTLDGLVAVSSGNMDALIGAHPTNLFYISQYQLFDLKTNLIVNNDLVSFIDGKIAVTKNNPLLHSIIVKAVNAVPPEHIFQLKSKWIGDTPEQNVVNFTPQERQYIQQNPTIRVQNEYDYPPFNYRSNDKPVGYSIDVMRKIADIAGLEPQFVSQKTWDQYLAMLKQGELDAMLNIMQTPSRKEYALFTTPYAQTINYAVTRKNEKDLVNHLNTDSEIRILVGKGYAITEAIQAAFPDHKLVYVDDPEQALNFLNNNLGDIYFDTEAVIDFYLQKYFMTGLALSPIPLTNLIPSPPLRIATHKDNPVLHSILQKSLKAIPESDWLQLRNRWFTPGRVEAPEINLSDEEKRFIAQNPVIRVQNESDFPPFNYQVDDTPVGYSIEVINEVAKRTGLKVELLTGKTWAQYLQMLHRSEMDAILNITYTPEREKLVNFTDGYASTSRYALTRQEDVYKVSLLEKDPTLRIVVAKGFSINPVLRRLFPNHQYVEVNSVPEALEKIKNYQGDIYFAHDVVINYYIQKHFLSGLKLTPLPPEFGEQTTSLRLATRKGNDVLHSILNKGLRDISEAEWIALRNKWFVTEQQFTTDVLLTQKEKDFLTNIEVLNVNIEPAFPPFSFIEGSFEKGYGVDLINHIASLLGVDVEYIEGSWEENLQRLREGSIDIIHSGSGTVQKRRDFLYTDTYIKTGYFAAVHQNEGLALSSLEGLQGKTIAAVRGHNNARYIEQHHPEISVVYYDSLKQCLEAVRKQKAFATIASQLALGYLIKQNKFDDIRLVPVEGLESVGGAHALSVHKDNQILRNILNKALLSLPPQFYQQLNQKWFGDPLASDSPMRVLSEEQIEWLKANNVQHLKLPDYGLPIGGFSEAGYQGIVSDFAHYIENKLGIRWKVITDDNKITNKAAESQSTDITLANPQSDPLSVRYIFSQPFVSMPVVVFTQDDSLVYVDDLSALDYTPSGLIDGTHYAEQVKKRYPNLQHLLYSDAKEALLAINKGEVQILLCPLLQCTYVMDQLGMNNTRIVGQTDMTESLAFAVRSDWPEMLEIINRLLSDMPAELRASIYRKWNIREDVLIKTDYTRFWYLLVFAMLVITTIIIWNRKISRYAVELENRRNELQQANQTIRTLLDYSGQGVLYFGEDFKAANEFSRECVAILGQAPSGKCIPTLLFPEDINKQEFLKSTIEKTLLEEDEFKTGVMLSLLPRNAELHDKLISVEYRRLPNRTMMLILTDKTSERDLQLEAQKEHSYAQQIIAITTDTGLFFETLNAFSQYTSELQGIMLASDQDTPVEQSKIAEIHRRTHTFKGLMMQFHLGELSRQLHTLEDILSKAIGQPWSDVRKILGKELDVEKLTHQLNVELEHAKQLLGDKYTAFQNETSVSRLLVDKISHLLPSFNSPSEENLSKLLDYCKQLTLTDVRKLLQAYDSIIENIAARAGKPLEPFEVKGHSILVDKKKWQPFLRSLIHIFRNSIAHGIESEDKRFEALKPQYGVISCHVSLQKDEIFLTIKDDGRGIDKQKIAQKAKEILGEENHMSASSHTSDWRNLLFVEQVTTAESADMFSGRGVGLAAVKREVDKLDGAIDVESETGLGTTFYISIPLNSVT